MDDKLFNIDIGDLDKGEYTLSWYERIMFLIPRPLWRRVLKLPAKAIHTWHQFSFKIHVKNDGFQIGFDSGGVYHNVQLKRRGVLSECVETAKRKEL